MSPYERMTPSKRIEAKKGEENWKQIRRKHAPGQKNIAVTEALYSGSENDVEVRDVSDVGTHTEHFRHFSPEKALAH